MIEPLCPWCATWIYPEQDTAKINGKLFHAGCAEDMAVAEAEVEA